ncbi:zinc finger protein OZF [Papilio machaon]|uniref:zinc finger protein OZF n=1 Tax=Papilio machaon TaxID=76193 RepID=UPI001E664ACE|nr:zinc finger protein OZF [Papilio machaon]
MMSLHTAAIDSNLYTYEYFQQEDVCRLCFSKHAEREIISKDSDDISFIKNQLIDKILYCLNIDVTELNHPNKVCENCIDVLDKFYEYKIFCSENDGKLREVLAEKSNVDKTDETCAVKVENNDTFELENSEYFDTYFLDLKNTDLNLASETLTTQVMDKKTKIKSNYKPVRTLTYCNICRIDYETVESFTEHNSTYHGIENDLYKCFGCEKKFKNRKTRLGHEINFCKGLKDGYQCNICNRYLPKRRIYENHMRAHRYNVVEEISDDIFKCLKCYKVFNTKTNLNKHIEEHNVEKKNFVCENCGRVFTRQDYLYKHKLIHTGVKQHVCAQCGFATTQKSSLTVHIRKHTGERPYECDLCPQRCVSSSNLRAHRRRHLGLKNYECTICSKKFGYKVSLEEHVASTHERANSHACGQCGAAYTRPRGLRRHVLTKHTKVNTDLYKLNEKVEEEDVDPEYENTQDVFIV